MPFSALSPTRNRLRAIVSAGSSREMRRRFRTRATTRTFGGLCRHLTHSDPDADDAFQATFWYYSQCQEYPRGGPALGMAARRRVQMCARVASNGEPPATRERAATWERTAPQLPIPPGIALAAVHEEVGKLPEVLRVPFVLCCLEGKGVTEAAEQLGWKLGTISGRLTRAKDALVAKLEARGLTLGALAGLALAAPPAGSIAKASSLARIGLVIPNSILQLTQGVIGMSMTSFKVLAAAVLLTCGLGLGVGADWVATAGAQPAPKQSPTRSDPAADVKRLQAELEKALEALAGKKQPDPGLEAMGRYLEAENYAALAAWMAAGQKGKEEPYTAKTTKWEYDFVEVSDLSQTKFVEFLQDRENRGWEFNGTTTLKNGSRTVSIWMFRRPAKGAAPWQALNSFYRRVAPNPDWPHLDPSTRNADPKAVDAEIARLRERLATLEGKATPHRVSFPKEELPLEARELAEILLKLAGKKFKDAHFAFYPSASGLAVEGDKEVIEWATALIKKLAEK